ncbi:MAG: hypothetical protein IT303_12210 [Dehalococcoidia bacterium]|nr:hypothetical protein [Dehalococcoidia bacterium]
MALSVYNLVQPAVVVRDIDQGVDRVYELFRAVPSERNTRPEFVNAVYAFPGYTYLEVLDGLNPAHTRTRFLDDWGPGLYMLCTDLANDEPAEIERDLAAANIRVVAPGRQTANITAGWHLHPRDAGSILVLHAVKKDRTDNRLGRPPRRRLRRREQPHRRAAPWRHRPHGRPGR